MSEPINNLKTARDVIGKIPSHWRNAEIFVGNSIGGLEKIRRVSLHTNAEGRRVVILHEKDFQ